MNLNTIVFLSLFTMTLIVIIALKKEQKNLSAMQTNIGIWASSLMLVLNVLGIIMS